MEKYNLHFAEKPLILDEKEIESKGNLLDFLHDKESIEINENLVIFKNFTGVLELDGKNHLIIPKKLAKYLELIDESENPIPDIESRYNQKFEKFLNYILTNLSRENIIYTLSLSKFPVEESKLNESKIFKLLLLLEKKEELINSLHLILSNPHRNLIKYETYKTIDKTTYIDADIVVDIIQNPARLYETENGIIQYESKSYAPTVILQYESEETFDILENRFIKYFLKELDFILINDLKEFMFIEELKQVKNEVEYVLQSEVFSEVGELNYFPSNSQVLMKRAGYKEIFQLYRLLHTSFFPKIFEDLDMAFSLKDMATLWEYYVLIDILKEFKKEFGNYKVEIDFEERSKYKTEYEEAKFIFEGGLILYFQKTKISYTGLEFRPDFFIEYNGKRYIFDAKFRIFENNKQDLLKNMHYYKDGLKLISAVIACLGKENKGGIFWQVDKKKQEFTSFKDIIKNIEGIGYINLILEIE